MASNIDISGLTMNPLEVDSIGEFIIQKVITDPVLNSIHTVWGGIKMKEQIVLAAQMGKTGITDATCTRPNSGASTVLTQKYWEPANVGDTMIHCQTDVNGLFKAYYTKIQKYVDLFDISGSDLDQFLMTMLTETIMKTVLRLTWLGDKSVAVAAAGAAGLVAAGDVKFYDSIDGLWEQIFAGVVATTIEHTTVKVAALNAQVTPAAQIALATDDAVAVFDDMWTRAPIRLRQDPSAKFYVSRELFDNYKKTLKTAGENFTIDYTTDGFQTVKWDGKDIVNMESIWDYNLRTDFVDNTTNNAYYLPNRAVLSTPENLPIGTLNEGDMSTLENWYNQDDRVMKTAYGFTLDAKVIDEDLIVAAY